MDKREKIKKFILESIENASKTVNRDAVNKFSLSRVTINNYIRELEKEGYIEASGNTKARIYKIKPLVENIFEIKLSADTPEDLVWSYRIMPLIKNVKKNVIDICQYCFTEILNNAIDHSASKTALINYEQTYNKIKIIISDKGIGIFEKIKNHFKLHDTRIALLELAKGKLTSDKKNHSGQGIFFTSRMVDEFKIMSGDLFYSRERQSDDEWLIEFDTNEEQFKGTLVQMEINLDTNRTRSEVFDEYQGKDFSFNKTHVPVKLSRYGNEQLVSRSQAKRVLARFDNFTEIALDFKDIPEIGQAFADEIFRVFRNAHPEINVFTFNVNPEVQKTINFVKAFDSNQKKFS